MSDFHANSQMLGEVQPGDDLSTIIKKPTIKIAGAAIFGAISVLLWIQFARKRR